MRSLLTATVCLLLVFVQTDAQSRRNIATQCRIVPSSGRCADAEKRRFWSYSSKIGACAELYGCYGIRDRNVFRTRSECARSCYITDTNNPSSNAYLDCEVNPSPGLCQDSEKRTYFSYSSKTSTCIQIHGCYSLSDRNIFLSREGCRTICIISRPSDAPLPTIIPGIPETLPSINNSASILPAEVGYKIAIGCTVNPSAGVCLPSQKRNYFTYSSKSGSCVQIYGCYSVRDRNVFLSRDTCRSNCIIRDTTGPTPEWSRDTQCYINPSPGRCTPNERQSMWSFSTKTNDCQQIFGCYSVRDRNVFRTLNNCRDKCVGTRDAVTLPTIDLNIKIALECRINPSPGVCTDREKNRFFSYSSKTGDCDEIYGCYSIRDRNVYLTRAGCRRSCFLSEGSTQSGVLESQCYLVPSQGVCRPEERRTYYTFTTKTNTCVRIFGCYGIRDRNVFLTRAGCTQSCSGEGRIEPVTPAVDFGTVEIVPLPEKGGRIAPECRINPSPGVCLDSQKRHFYTYSSKTSSCVRIFGCYNIRDRNVFMLREGCRRRCYLSGSTTPPGGMDRQCYLNPAPGRCPDSEKRTYWSYNSNTMSCRQLYGCYSIRDRNVFLRKEGCARVCNRGVTTPQTPTMPPIPIRDVNLECRINPSPGRCREQDRRTYFTYSTKTHRCTEIYGCYSVRDRNVFLTRELCRQGCFKTNKPPNVEVQCSINPSPGNCAENRRRNYYSYSSKTSTCVQIYGCYSVRDRNVFLTRAGCRRNCVLPRIGPDTNFVDVRNGGTTNMVDVRNDQRTNMVDVRNGGGTNNMVDVRNGGTTNMVDVRNGGGTSNMVDVRNGQRTNMVDVRNGGGSKNMVDVRNSGGTSNMIDVRNGGGTNNMVDVRNGGGTSNMVDVRNGGTTNMIDVRNGQRTNMVDVRNGGGTSNMVDVRNGQRTNMVDVRNGGGTNNMVDVRNGGGTSNMVDVRNGGVTNNMVDVRNGGGTNNMVDVRNDQRTNMVDVRNGGGTSNMVDVRNDRRTNMVDVRNDGSQSNMVDVRNNRRTNMVDVRNGGGQSNMIDVRNRGGASNNMIDVRNNQRTNMVDVRNGGGTSNMVDVRNDRRTNLVDVRNVAGKSNMVDVRNGGGGNMIDVRNGGRDMVDIIRGGGLTMQDIRNGKTEMTDIRSSGRSNMVDVRNPLTNMIDVRGKGTNMVDVRSNSGSTNMVDVRGNPVNMVDVRGNGGTTNMVDVRADGTKMVDVRGNRVNMVDVRGNGGSANMVDVRGNAGSTNMIDVRGNRANMVDVRGNGGSANMVDVRGNRVDMVDVRGNGGSTNMVDVRGNAGSTNMVDVRADGTKMVDVRGNRINMVDVRGNGGSTNMVDVRGNAGSTNMVDVRADGTRMVDVRGNRVNMVDVRGNGGSANMVDVRGNRVNMVDVRGNGGSANMVDVRGNGGSANMVDVRGNAGSSNMVDVRGNGGSANMVDVRGNGGSANMVDVRGNAGSANMVDVRADGTRMVDVRGNGVNMVDVRGNVGPSTVDIRRNIGASNMIDVRNDRTKMTDLRNDKTNMVDVRGTGNSNMVDVRHGTSGPFVDIRGNQIGTNLVDIRGGRNTNNMVDVRGGGGSGSVDLVDIRGGKIDAGMVDVRGGKVNVGMVDVRGGKVNAGMVDVRGGKVNDGMVDVRGGQIDGGMVDVRGGQTRNNMIDIRGGKVNAGVVDIRAGQTGSGMVDVRGGQTGNTLVDIRAGQTGKGMTDIRGGQNRGSMVDVRGGQIDGGMVDIRAGQTGNAMTDIRGGQAGIGMIDIRAGQTGSGMLDIRGGQTGSGMLDIRGGQTGSGMLDIRGGQTGSGMTDIRGGQSGTNLIDIRGKQNMVDIREGTTNTRSNVNPLDPQSLTDLPIINIEPGIRIARECLINPTPGFCLENQRKTFWTFSTKTNSCTRIMGCFDIHDRNTWLTLQGCRNNCFKNDSAVEDNSGVLPLECQLNPTPGRCLPSDEHTVWVYNTKLGACTQITGCYDFHDRNVWSSRQRCRTKCRVNSTIIAPEIPYDIEGLRIHPECHINPSPGSCLENQQKTFWTFSSKTSACTRITGCYNIRDRNTWRSRAECRNSCYVNGTDVSFAKPLECKLVPSPGRCLDSQKKSVYTYSDKLGVCVEITGCYDFHDRNVWRTVGACNERCHVNVSVIPDLSQYDIAQGCQLNPIPGRCTENQKRSFYTFSKKAGGCVEIYGCYTINDRNVWYTRNGCRSSCLLPKTGSGTLPDVARTCLRPPISRPCIPNQQQEWYSFDINTGACERIQGCYRMRDQNVFTSRRQCELGCYNRQPEYTIGGIARECRLNPTPGVCRVDERKLFWSYSQKTGTCVELNGCYTIRDRNIWLSRDMCRNNCIKREIEPRSNVIPNFLARGSNGVNGIDINGLRRGRRGRILSRNMNRNAPRMNDIREISGTSESFGSGSAFNQASGDITMTGNGNVDNLNLPRDVTVTRDNQGREVVVSDVIVTKVDTFDVTIDRNAPVQTPSTPLPPPVPTSNTQDTRRMPSSRVVANLFMLNAVE